MSILTKGFSDEIEGYQVQTDFRLWLDFEKDLSSMNSPYDIIRLLKKYYRSKPDKNPIKAISLLVSFYTGEEEESGAEGKAAGGRPSGYDYEVDAPLIYAAFLSQYGIDLTVAQLHWHSFLYLFRNLGEEQKISKIIGYRTVDLDKIKEKEQKNMYRKLKQMYRLPSTTVSDDTIGEVFSCMF